MGKRTPLYDAHLAAHGKIIEFHGWEMPLHYGSQIEEHHAARNKAGFFDVSHMTIIDITGIDAKSFLQYVLANDAGRLLPGHAFYSCMLNQDAGVVDDLIVFFIRSNHYRLIVNSATRAKDLAWLEQHSENKHVTITEIDEPVMLAIQGPESQSLCHGCLPQWLQLETKALKPFSFVEEQGWMVARTGYTGERGIEVLLPAQEADTFWQCLLDAGIQPCGLGARDTLRLEAGLNLYGNDMDEATHPLESNLAWTVAWVPESRDFIGREKLGKIRKQGSNMQLVGLVLEKGGVLRTGQAVFCQGKIVGNITSGGFSPTLGCSIAFARIPTKLENDVQVKIRDKEFDVQVVSPPFVRHGKRRI